MGQLGPALERFREGIRLAPDRPDFWLAYAQVANQAGAAEAVVEACVRAIRLKRYLLPAHELFFGGLAVCSLGQARRLAEEWASALDAGPDLNSAIDGLAGMFSGDPRGYTTFSGLANLCGRLGEWDAAVRCVLPLPPAPRRRWAVR